jgi:hypothetical protein
VLPLESIPPHEVVHETAEERRRSALAVDEWGRDARLIRALGPLAAARWNVSIGGASSVRDGAALIVVNARRFALTPLYVAWALGDELGRPARFVGRPDIVPFGPLLRRVGGLLSDPAEVAGALRSGEVLVLGAAGTISPRHAGAVDHTLVAAARREGVPVHPTATIGTAISRHVRVEVGPPLRPARRRRGPLADVEFAELVQRRLQSMLDELGPAPSGVPLLGWSALDWAGLGSDTLTWPLRAARRIAAGGAR